MVNNANTTDVLDLFQQMRVELREKIEISKGVILHYAPVSDHEYWDYNLLPEVCTLYSSFLHLDAGILGHHVSDGARLAGIFQSRIGCPGLVVSPRP